MSEQTPGYYKHHIFFCINERAADDPRTIKEENGLPVTDENIFIYGAFNTKNANKGLDFLKGNFKVSVPKKDPNKVAAPAPAPAPVAAAPVAAAAG